MCDGEAVEDGVGGEGVFGDGSTVRLTDTPEHESSARWTPDGSQLVFARGDYFERIVQVDMSTAVSGIE